MDVNLTYTCPSSASPKHPFDAPAIAGHATELPHDDPKNASTC
jgi:hypothetical protein